MVYVDFWQDRYQSGNMPWDLGHASPHFEYLLKTQSEKLPPGRMAVLGSGRGHDAAYFAAAGFEVTGFDYAPGAVEAARQLYGNAVTFVQADICDLAFAAPGSPYHQAFDYLLEHTCFCAIHPSQRDDYARSARDLLKPGGLLIGVFWEHGDDDGPPHNTTLADVDRHFGEGFERIRMEERPPVSDREGVERLLLLRRK